MIDIKFLRENPDIVKQNIKNKFQDHKLGLVDEVIELDASSRTVQQEADDLRANRNRISKQIGALMGQGKKEEAMALKEQVAKDAERLTELEAPKRSTSTFSLSSFPIGTDGSMIFGMVIMIFLIFS